jgi:hypothetical protein
VFFNRTYAVVARHSSKGKYFSALMERPIKRFWDQIHILLWFIVVILVFIFCLAIINGYGCGFKNSLIAHGVLGFVVVGCLLILLTVFIALEKLFRFFEKRQKSK